MTNISAANPSTKLLGLRTAIYHVSDLKAAKEWYGKVLDRPPYFDEPFYVGFEVGGYELGLVPLETAALAGGSPNVYWGVGDASAAFARLVELGATAKEPVHDVGAGIEVGLVQDPWGNLLGVIFNPHFKLPDAP